MNCTFCDKEIIDPVLDDGKVFCDNLCVKDYYKKKIIELTKSEKVWHDEWYNSRDTIGRIGLEIMYFKHPEWRVKNA